MRKILKIVLYITAALLFAVFIYTKNKEGNERAATSLYFEGKKLEAEGKYPEALAKLKKAVGLKPDLGKGYLMIGVVYSREDDFPQAAEEFKKALTAKLDKRNKAITHHNLGAIYLEQFNKPDEAIEQFNLAIKTDPNFIDPASDPHFGLSRAYIVKGQYDLAIREARESIRLNPASDKAYFSLGIVYSLKQDVKEARLLYEELSKKDSRASVELKAMLDSWETFVFMLPDIKKTGAVSEETKIFFKKIDMYSAMGDKEGAKKLALKRLEEKPRDILARVIIYNYYYDNNDLAEARKILEQGLGQGKDDYALLMTLGVSYLSGNVSLPDFSKKGQLFPGVTREDLDKAEGYFLKAYEYYPDFAHPLYYLARIYESKQDMQKAAYFLEKAYRINPDDIHSGLSLANLMLEAGNTKEAEKILGDIYSRQVNNYYNARICQAFSGLYRRAAEIEKADFYDRLYRFYNWLLPIAKTKYSSDFENNLSKLAVFKNAGPGGGPAGPAEKDTPKVREAIDYLSAVSADYALEFIASVIWNANGSYAPEIQKYALKAIQDKGKTAIPYLDFLANTRRDMRQEIEEAIRQLK